jgi:hypothetical protein
MIENEVNWVLSVVESCETEQQLQNSCKLFNFLIKKYEYELSEVSKIVIWDKFLDKKIEKTEKIKKYINNN